MVATAVIRTIIPEDLGCVARMISGIFVRTGGGGGYDRGGYGGTHTHANFHHSSLLLIIIIVVTHTCLA